MHLPIILSNKLQNITSLCGSQDVPTVIRNVAGVPWTKHVKRQLGMPTAKQASGAPIKRTGYGNIP